jgi:Flp pilus assembly protein TadD
MISALLIAGTVAAATPGVPARVAAPPSVSLADVEHAIAAGRLDQARIMISRAIASGMKGTQIDRPLADLAYASGNYAEALARYEKLLQWNPNDRAVAERAGLAALKLGDAGRAAPFIDRVTHGRSASWRAWNALGVIADFHADWTKADEAYSRAILLAPNRGEVVNNRGWSHLLRGDWRAAVADFERAAALSPKGKRIANNLELARAALANDLPQRLPNESDEDWSARLNDAGMAAELLGDSQRAIAAFTQALEANGSWYERAANNLRLASGQ